ARREPARQPGVIPRCSGARGCSGAVLRHPGRRKAPRRTSPRSPPGVAPRGPAPRCRRRPHPALDRRLHSGARRAASHRRYPRYLLGSPKVEGGPIIVTPSAEPQPLARIGRNFDVGSGGVSSVLLLLFFVLFVGVVRSQSALILLSSLLIVTAIGATLWSRSAPRELVYRRYFDPPRIFPGEETEY